MFLVTRRFWLRWSSRAIVTSLGLLISLAPLAPVFHRLNIPLPEIARQALEIPTAHAAWYSGSWSNRVGITIDADQVDSDLTDFPVYVDLSDLPASFFSTVQSDGDDIRVTKSDGTTEVPIELEVINTGGSTGVLWFKADGTLSSSSNTTFYIYYGNAGASAYAIDATYGAENVWNSNYTGVWHLHDDFLDSTSNDYDATNSGTTDTTGKFGDGQDFSSDQVNLGKPLNASAGSVSLWVNEDADNTVDRPISDGGGYIYMQKGNPNSTQISSAIFDTGTKSTAYGDITSGTWSHLTMVWGDSGNHRFYINGSLIGSIAAGDIADVTTYDLLLGGSIVSVRWDGQIDEARVSSAVLSADWIDAEYTNQNTPDTFYSAGSEEQNESISGTVYTDEGSTNIGANKTVAISINGAVAAATDETDSDGAYEIDTSALSISAGDVVTVYLDGETEQAAAVNAMANSAASVDLYQNYLIVQDDNGSNITNSNLATADNNGDADITDFYSVSGSDVTVSDGKELLIWTGDTYAPGGAVIADDIDINGTFTMGANAVTVSGTWDATGGTFTGSNTVTFDSTSTETITSNSNAFNNVTLNGSGGIWNLQDNADINGTLTISNGTFDLNGSNLDNTSGSFTNNDTLRLQGGETLTSLTMDTNSGTVDYDGTGTYASGLAGGDSYYNLTFSGSGSWTLDANTDVDGNLTISAGTVDVSGSNYNISLAGNWSNSGGTFNEQSGTVTFDGAVAQTVTGETFYDLTINNSHGSPDDDNDIDSSAAVTVSNTLTITDGQFQPATSSDFSAISVGANGILKPDSGASITASGSWTNSGTFTHNSGTITFDGTSQTLTGDTTFYNFTKTEGANDSTDETLTFTAGDTMTISNTWTLDGRDANDQINLVSSSPGTSWVVSPTGTRTIDFVDVTDSNNTSGTDVVCSNDCTNGGSNTNWTFPVSITVYTDEGSTGIGSGKTVAISVDGGSKTTAETNGSSIATVNSSIDSGDVVAVWLDDETENGMTVTVSNGTTLGFSIYQNRLILQHETGSNITNSNLATADGSADDDITAIYTESSGAVTIADSIEVFIPSGDTYAPGGTVTLDDIDINGTFTMASNDVTVSGAWDATGGTFTGSNTVTFDSGDSDEAITSNSNTFNDVTFDGSNNGTWTQADAFEVTGTLTVQSGGGGGDSTAPTVSSVTEANLDSDSVDISWSTDENAIGYIDYGTSSGTYTHTAGEGDNTYETSKTAKLVGLSASTTYYYRVSAVDAAGNLGTSSEGSFTTSASSEDTTAPTISSISESSLDSDSVDISWSTSENAIGYINYGTSSGSYTHTAGEGDDTYETSKTAKLVGLSASTKYYYKVTAVDAAGNRGTSSEGDFTTSSASSGSSGDTTNPSISSISSSDVTSTGATITWSTDEDTVGYVNYGTTSGTYTHAAGIGDNEYDQSKSAKVIGLNPSTKYYYQVVAIDEAGNLAQGSESTLTTISASSNSSSSTDVTAPSITSEQPSVTSITGTSATVSWSTNEAANSFVSYRILDSADPLLTAGGSDFDTSHSVKITGLSQAQEYEYYVESVDKSGNKFKSATYQFTTSLPQVSGVSVQNLTENSGDFVYETEGAVQSIIELTNLNTGDTLTLEKDDVTLSHRIALEDLSPNSSYSAAVLIKGDDDSVTRTLGYVFNTRPDFIDPILSLIETRSALVEGQSDAVQTVVIWRTDEPATSQVQYREGISDPSNTEFDQFTEETTDYVNKHVVVLTDLKPSTVYQYRVVSEDRAGHKVESEPRVLLTPARRVSALDLIINNLEDTFGWTRSILN